MTLRRIGCFVGLLLLAPSWPVACTGTDPDITSANGADAGNGGDGAADVGQVSTDAGDASADTGADAGRGPARIPVAGGYSIDATEVTQGQYAAFVEAIGSGVAPGLPAECSFKSTHVPGGAWPPAPDPGERALPVTRVDWCDAVAFCAWAGGRLCGAKAGGSVAGTLAERTNRDVDQWFSACTHGGDRALPYAGTFDGTKCNGAQAGKGGPIAVATLSTCEGGYPGIFDMSGNVYEWEDSCVGDAGATDTCAVRGGSYASPQAELVCASAQDDLRNTRVGGVGFRCCGP